MMAWTYGAANAMNSNQCIGMDWALLNEAGDEGTIDQQRKFVPPNSVYRQMTVSEEFNELGSAEALALEALTSNTNCWNLFNLTGNGMDPVDLLISLGLGGPNGGISYGPISEFGVAATAKADGFKVSITLNDDANGPWGSDSTLQQAGTLLHELGHAYWILYGPSSSLIEPDSTLLNGNNATEKSEENTALIQSACLKGLP